MLRRDVLGAVAALATSTPTPGLRAQASAWPQRPVRWILSQAAGAGPDILARYVGEQLARVWGRPVVVDNRPGGQNVIGAQAAARSAPDGYTFYYATTAAMVTNPLTFRSLPYDPAKDFVPVRLIGRSPFVLAAGTALPGKGLAEVLADARAQPGVLTIATEGGRTFSGMLADAVAHLAGVKFNHIPYTKSSDAMQDVLAGRVQLVCLPDAALSSYVKAGQVRPLAVSTPRRLPDLPQVPALAESFPGFEYTGWNGLFAPTGTPPELVARVNRDLETVLRAPEVAQRMQALGSIVEPGMSVPEAESFMRSERERWSTLVKNLGILPE
ncbi:hypothetical protein PMI14_01122 [Acidovorax sp. CF316]|uniref:Bug family tripartite tricarboxylate transporter substrate binding protein n=1 Tax=Acidovorax sp. CF316 TaxID=1144317 RepID=UPI00026BD2FB|nr:tripartite tricarboxylate transporter substrate-binding protein [Acidovorax sp. CF316]EJE53958.1 hypothetical protein PMI14_01122 [Acidovorax sp. CF316]